MTLILALFNFLHFVGLAFGLGGATIAAIIFAKAEKDKDVASAVNKIMPSIVKLIWLGLILLIISGIALPFFIKWPLNTKMLVVKHVLVVWIIIVGIIIGIKMRKVKNLVPVLRERPSLSFLKAKKQVKILSMINLVLWYIVTLLSVFV